jgi:hypothetical protein
VNPLARYVLVGSWAAASLAAAPAVDLGQGLAYFRVHELPADLPSAAAGHAAPCVIDLRFARSDDPAAAALSAWVKFNASARTPVFVLENSATSPALLAALPPTGAPGVLVLAPASEKLAADFAVRVSAERDRLAYQAVENGAPVLSLLRDSPEKPRLDEAYLEKEHLADTAAPDIESDKPSPPSPLVDSLLQRAVQLQRGLLALKRI